MDVTIEGTASVDTAINAHMADGQAKDFVEKASVQAVIVTEGYKGGQQVPPSILVFQVLNRTVW